MKQNIWSRAAALVMTICMAITMVPSAALAAEENTEPSGGTELQDITQTGLDLTTLPTEETTYKAGSGTVTYTPTEDGATITLNNATIDVEATTYGTPGIKLPNGKFNIVVPENTKSTISSTKKVSDTCQAITSPGGSVKISGGGTLDLNAYSEAVYVYHDDDGSLTIQNCTVNLHSIHDDGAYVEYDIALDHAKVAYSCDAEIDSDDGPYANGLNSTDGNVIISDSTYSFGNSFYGVSAENQGAVIIQNSTVTGKNCRSGFNVYPDSNDDETLKNLIENSNVHIESAEAAFVDEGATEIKNSRVFMRSANDVAVDHWYDGITVSGKSYVELKGADHAAFFGRIQGKNDFTLEDDLAIVEGKLNERVTSGKNQSVNTTQRLVIAASAVVTFDSQGGSNVEAYHTYAGAKVTEPTAPTREDCNFAGWYREAACKTAWNFGTDTVAESMTLYAKWLPETTTVYSASGTVTGTEGEDMSGTVVKLMQGTSVIAAVTTGQDGKFTFANLPAGSYTITAEKDSRGVTTSISTADDLSNLVLELPTGDIKTEVTVDENTPNTYVSGLDELGEDSQYAPTGTEVVRIVLNVAAKEESALQAETVSAIKNLSGSETLTYLEMDITRFVNNVSQGNITDTDPHLQFITIDYDTAGKNISVYRVHNDTASKLTEAGSTPTDGTYHVNNGSITIYATKFSTYAIGYTNRSSGGHGGSTTTTYPVAVNPVTNGTIKADKSSAAKGSTVTITVTPDKGYELGKLTVTDKDGKMLSLTSKGNGQYTFTMPAGKVTVTASFAETDWDLAYRNCPKDSTCPIWPYTDAETTAWYHDGVHFCLENGLMVGYGNHIFKPDTSTSRAMLSVMLWRLSGSPVVNYAMTFTDVAADSWYGEAVRWAASQGIVTGYDAQTFGPNNNVTREQMVTILHRYAQTKGYDVSVGENTNLLSYADAASVSAYAIPAMQWGCGSGMVQGTDNKLVPQGSTTRAQMATMMMRFCAEIVK